MKRIYNKPEIEVYSFDVNTSVMTSSPTPTPTFGIASQSGGISDVDMIPSVTEQAVKKYYNVDDENWHWEE